MPRIERIPLLVIATAAAAWLTACGSIQLPRALSPPERMEVEAASIPAVVGVLPRPIRNQDEDLRRILDDSGLFLQVELAEELEPAPDLLVRIERGCEEKATTLVPMFTFFTAGILPTWVRDHYGDSIAFFSPGEPARRVEIGCSEKRYTAVFGWLGTPLNVLPGWTLTDPVKHPRYGNRLALEVARREDELRELLEP